MTGQGRRDGGLGRLDDSRGGWGRGELEPERRVEPLAGASRRRFTQAQHGPRRALTTDAPARRLSVCRRTAPGVKSPQP